MDAQQEPHIEFYLETKNGFTRQCVVCCRECLVVSIQVEEEETEKQGFHIRRFAVLLNNKNRV